MTSKSPFQPKVFYDLWFYDPLHMFCMWRAKRNVSISLALNTWAVPIEQKVFSKLKSPPSRRCLGTLLIPPLLCCFSFQKVNSFYSVPVISGDNRLILWFLHKRHKGSYNPTSTLKMIQKANLFSRHLKPAVVWVFFPQDLMEKNIQALFRGVWF